MLHHPLDKRWSHSRVVVAAVDVKFWERRFPSVDAVRPKRCPCCGGAGRPVGERLGLVGHGVRRRLQLGPARPDEPPDVAEITVRRYLCRDCGAVVTVVPRGVAPRLRYRLRAIAWALGRWWQGASAAAVRREVSPFRRVGEEAQRGWRSLRRWVRALGGSLGIADVGAPHLRLERVLQRLAAKALDASGELVRDAVEGVVFIDVHHVRRGGLEAPTT